MVKRKRNQPTVEDILERPWCYYCERDFDDLKILISHQKAKHYKCSLCTRRLNTAGGLSVHMSQVHKESLTSIENALPNRKDVTIEIFGMEGMPEDVLNAHRQRITAEYFKKVAERRAETGNPPPGSGQATTQKRPKIESAEEIKQRLAEHKARREAERLGKAGGDRASTTPLSASGPFAAPGATDGQSQDSPVPMDPHQEIQHAKGSPFTMASPFSGNPMQPAATPIMSPGAQFYGPPMPSPIGPGPPFGMPPHGMPMYPGSAPPFPPPPSMGIPLAFHPMHQHNLPRPGGLPFANGHQHSPVPPNPTKPPAELNKQLSSLELDVPGLPARPSTNAPNLNREDMARLHAGAPARQVSTSHISLTSSGGATDQAGEAAAAAASSSIDDLITSVRESKPDASVPAIDHNAHNNVPTTTAEPQTADPSPAATPAVDEPQIALTGEAAEVKTTKGSSTKKAGKKSKGADRETRMVYTDEVISPEEKRAILSRYAFKRDDSTTYVKGDAGPAVTGPVRASDDVMDTEAAH